MFIRRSSSCHQSLLLSQRHVSNSHLPEQMAQLGGSPFRVLFKLSFPRRSSDLTHCALSCCSVSSLRLKISAACSSPSPFRFYNANVETLLESNKMGGAGFSGISANFYPWMHVRLCSADTTEEDKARIQRFLSVAEVDAGEHLQYETHSHDEQFRWLSVMDIRNQRRREAALVCFDRRVLHIAAEFALL